MSLRDTVRELIDSGEPIEVYNPLCSKRLVTKKLEDIVELLDSGYPLVGYEYIKCLILDIGNGKYDAGNL